MRDWVITAAVILIVVYIVLMAGVRLGRGEMRRELEQRVAGMMYVHPEDLVLVYELRHARGETIDCEKCDLVYDPADHDDV